MKTAGVTAVVFLLVMCASLASAADVLRLRKVEVIDAQGWGQPVVAYTLLAPADWRVEGGIRWNAQWRFIDEPEL